MTYNKTKKINKLDIPSDAIEVIVTKQERGLVSLNFEIDNSVTPYPIRIAKILGDDFIGQRFKVRFDVAINKLVSIFLEEICNET